MIIRFITISSIGVTLLFATMQDNFWDVFSSGPVLDNLGKHLGIEDIVNLSRTCRELSGIYHEFLPLKWDVDRLLRRFVGKPKMLRKQMGLAEALITGSFALEFFDNASWHAPNLDIVVKDGQGIRDLCDYLSACEFYVVVEGDEHEDMPHGFRYVDKVSGS